MAKDDSEADSGHQTSLLKKLDRVREKLADIEGKRARIEDRQDRIDNLAIRTLCAMNHLHGRIQTYSGVHELDRRLVHDMSRTSQRSPVLQGDGCLKVVDRGVQVGEGDIAGEAAEDVMGSKKEADDDDDDEDSDTFASESLGKFDSDPESGGK